MRRRSRTRPEGLTPRLGSPAGQTAISGPVFSDSNALRRHFLPPTLEGAEDTLNMRVDYELRPAAVSIGSERPDVLERYRLGTVDQRLSAERQRVIRSALRQAEDTGLRSMPRGAKDHEQLQDDPRSFGRSWRLFRNISISISVILARVIPVTNKEIVTQLSKMFHAQIL